MVLKSHLGGIQSTPCLVRMGKTGYSPPLRIWKVAIAHQTGNSFTRNRLARVLIGREAVSKEKQWSALEQRAKQKALSRRKHLRSTSTEAITSDISNFRLAAYAEVQPSGRQSPLDAREDLLILT